MSGMDWLAEQFEQNRGHLRGVAYRMLGSVSEAEDAVQESWLRLSRTDTQAVQNLGGWLTTVVARVCLDMLRSRKSRREEVLDAPVPEAAASREGRVDPEQEALLADSVGLALLVVLEKLTPAERLAFVLHDMFSVPFDEIATIVGRSPAAARQIASRARRRVQGAPDAPRAELTRQRKAVEAFLAAAREGNFEALLAVLDPDVVHRADAFVLPPAGREVRGAEKVAQGAVAFSRVASTQPAPVLVLIESAVGVVITAQGQVVRAVTFSVQADRITEISVIADPERLAALDLGLLGS